MESLAVLLLEKFLLLWVLQEVAKQHFSISSAAGSTSLIMLVDQSLTMTSLTPSSSKAGWDLESFD